MIIRVHASRAIKSIALGIAMLAIGPAHANKPLPPVLNGDIRIGGTGAALGTMQKLADAFRKTHPEVHFRIVPSLGSGGGIKALGAGELSLSVSSRALTDAERAKGLSAGEIAKTPFVFVTGPKTPVANLTLEQVAALYSGKTARWSDGTLVRPVLRPLGDIDTQLVRDMSPALAQAVQQAHQRESKNIAATDSDSADEVERIPGSFGTSTLALILTEGRRLKILTVEGISPGMQGMANHRYPYVKPLYLVTSSKTSPAVQEFVRFVDSSAGSGVLIQSGSIPLPGAP